MEGRCAREREIAEAIERIDEYLEQHLDIITRPVIEFMSDQEVKTITLIAKRFRTNAHYIINIIDYLSEKGVLEKVCPECNGARLKKQRLHVTVGGMNVDQLSRMQLPQLLEFLRSLTFSEDIVDVANSIIREISARVQLLIDVGLHLDHCKVLPLGGRDLSEVIGVTVWIEEEAGGSVTQPAYAGNDLWQCRAELVLNGLNAAGCVTSGGSSLSCLSPKRDCSYWSPQLNVLPPFYRRPVDDSGVSDVALCAGQTLTLRLYASFHIIACVVLRGKDQAISVALSSWRSQLQHGDTKRPDAGGRNPVKMLIAIFLLPHPYPMERKHPQGLSDQSRSSFLP